MFAELEAVPFFTAIINALPLNSVGIVNGFPKTFTSGFPLIEYFSASSLVVITPWTVLEFPDDW